MEAKFRLLRRLARPHFTPVPPSCVEVVSYRHDLTPLHYSSYQTRHLICCRQLKVMKCRLCNFTRYIEYRESTSRTQRMNSLASNSFITIQANHGLPRMHGKMSSLRSIEISVLPTSRKNTSFSFSQHMNSIWTLTKLDRMFM